MYAHVQIDTLYVICMQGVRGGEGERCTRPRARAGLPRGPLLLPAELRLPGADVAPAARRGAARRDRRGGEAQYQVLAELLPNPLA